MIVEFSVTNYRSYNQKATFSMVAGAQKEHPEHVFKVCNLNLLKTSVLYGANASGKSNLIKAMGFMKRFVLTSQRITSSTDKIRVEPFLLKSSLSKEPSEFEIVLVVHDSIYRYGFAVSPNEVIKEWLYIRECKRYARELRLFARKDQTLELHDSLNSFKEILEKLRPNALFLSFLDQFNEKHSKLLISFVRSIQIVVETDSLVARTYDMISDNRVPKEWVRKFFIAADIGIDDFALNEENVDWEKLHVLVKSALPQENHPRTVKEYDLRTQHKYYDSELGEYNTVSFNMQSNESSGTKRLFGYAGLLYYVLTNGGILIIDEIDNSLHYYLTKIIIELFQSKLTNVHGAQLFFTSHDINHLDKSRFRRDEIWFTEKDQSAATVLYSLAEYKARNDASFGKDYLNAKYGAVPFVDFDSFAQLLTDTKK